jgi:hypothetical protein
MAIYTQSLGSLTHFNFLACKTQIGWDFEFSGNLLNTFVFSFQQQKKRKCAVKLKILMKNEYSSSPFNKISINRTAIMKNSLNMFILFISANI